MKQPIVERISQWGAGREILYKCPCCDTSFRILADKELWCHNCGQPIDWDYVPREVNTVVSELYHNGTYEQRKKLINSLNIAIKLNDYKAFI